jgi:hypothetical protein
MYTAQSSESSGNSTVASQFIDARRFEAQQVKQQVRLLCVVSVPPYLPLLLFQRTKKNALRSRARVSI